MKKYEVALLLWLGKCMLQDPENILALPSGFICDFWRKPLLKIDSRKVKKDNCQYAAIFEGHRWTAACHVCNSTSPFLTCFVSMEGGKLKKLPAGTTTHPTTSQFFCPIDTIDQHPNYSKGEIVYYQAPNVTKFKISWLLLLLTLSRGNQQQKQKHNNDVSFVNDIAAMVQLIHVGMPNEDIAITSAWYHHCSNCFC